MVEKFAAKNPSCIAYDEKLQFYSNLANEVGSTGHIHFGRMLLALFSWF